MSEQIPDIFLNPYNPADHEQKIYQQWLDSGFFNPDICIEKGICAPDAETFSIVLPPPNVTGVLHLGHAFEGAMQDVLIRFNRMCGKRTLWLPGTDHAAIATQSKFEKQHYKETKKARHDYPREEFVDMIQEFALENQNKILSQLRATGASLDWSRLCFTLDEKRQESVFQAFKRMHDTGLIYQKDRIVNWDPKGQTTISNDEVIRKEETAKFYYFKYGPFTIGTARPETKFGDKYIVMHPQDERYSDYEHGQQIDLEWINGPITATIIKDEAADPEFGTGVMTITPWHSQVDFEIAERHNLDKEQIINKYGKLLPIAMEFEGMKISDAREKIVEKLASKGLVEKIEEGYTHHLATAERTGGIIEPQIMLQWWVNVDKKFPYPHETLKGIEKGQEVSLKDLMLHVVSDDQVTIMPERFDKTYRHWITNLYDWNISRQILYGHRIPAWYKNGEVAIAQTSPGEGWEQDPDTLDTWFSSGLWTFSTLGWPDNASADLTSFHPTNLVNPGYEILPLWVARMILMSTFLVGEIPFETAFIHGMLRDTQGRKFSKSLDNGIDPLEVIDKYGTDALRISLLVGVTPGMDMNFDLQKVNAYKKFANKIWNATRFVLQSTLDYDASASPIIADTHEPYLVELETIIESTTNNILGYKLHLASEGMYHYFWHTFADIIIEECKEDLDGDDLARRQSAQYVLLHILKTSLKLLHPFMPFITETIWQHLPPKDTAEQPLLMVAKWPVINT